MTRRPLTQGLQRILAAMPDDWIDQDDLNQRLGYASGVGTTLAAMERRGVIERREPKSERSLAAARGARGHLAAGHPDVARGRKATHRISRPHPHKRCADLITMLNYRRGPEDDIWGARFWIDGKWQPKDGVSLGTRDFDEAAEIARENTPCSPMGIKSSSHERPRRRNMRS